MGTEKIIVKINDKPKIYVKFGNQGLKGDRGLTGPQGPTGPAGSNNHALLTNLDYVNAGHTGFQKKLNYILEFKAYEIE